MNVFAMASGYEMKASPVPPEPTTSSTREFSSLAKLPRIPKIVKPDSKLVRVSKVVTIIASLKSQMR